jgi:hypothetical protein
VDLKFLGWRILVDFSLNKVICITKAQMRINGGICSNFIDAFDGHYLSQGDQIPKFLPQRLCHRTTLAASSYYSHKLKTTTRNKKNFE